MRLIFVRHTSVAVPKGVCYGQTDVPLADSFVDEALKVKTELSRYKIECAYTSPLSRCFRLAEFCGFADAIQDPRLMEMNFGRWEMMRYDEIDDPTLRIWYDDYLNAVPTGGESSMMQRERLAEFLNTLDCGSDKTIAIFTHGGIIIHALVMLGGISYKDAYSFNPPYGAVVGLSL